MSGRAKRSAEKNRYLAAPRNEDWTIDQDWASYTPEEHARWDRLFARQSTLLPGKACQVFLDQLGALSLSDAGIPHMGRLSDRLEKRTGWRVVPVAELVPDDVFFEHLANKRFPAGAFIRPESEFDYLEEPDVFHDIFGHVPLLADPVFSDYMQAFGAGGARALERGQLHHLARLYWYTVEFGLVREAGGLKLFGAGILSSPHETHFALEDPSPNRIAFDLQRVMRTRYRIDDFQQTYFIIDSFDALLETCYRDFGTVYCALRNASDISPSEVLTSDTVITRGSQAYFTEQEAR
ncbi:MAG: phenylalanine 4-monooxygenase [Pseudomonadota bacterium]